MSTFNVTNVTLTHELFVASTAETVPFPPCCSGSRFHCCQLPPLPFVRERRPLCALTLLSRNLASAHESSRCIRKTETQYIIAGDGELHMEDGSKHPVGPGSVFVLPTPVKHDLVNVGNETLRAVAFFAAAMFTQNFDNVMMPPKSHILGTPNREG